MNHASDARQAGGRLPIATLGGGCFWCLEAIFDQLVGVVSVESGYSGGQVPHPTYEQVCSGRTGHAEVVQVTFDPRLVSFRQLLEVFFTVHDPTTQDRQGGDVGPQYRSAIFYHDEEQKRISLEVIQEIASAKLWGGAIVTEVAPFQVFYRAEPYHQQYYENNRFQPYCQLVIAPKVLKFRAEHMGSLRR